MSAFARSDVLYTAPTLADGGCGRGHSRPVVQGAPVKIWELNDCPQCENYLRNHDPHWAGTISEIPETPDEVLLREDQELRGKRDAATATAQSLEKIANLPEGMATAFASAFAEALKTLNAAPALPTADKRCPGGHLVPRDAKFCPECGARSWKAPAKVVESSVVQPEDASPDLQYVIGGTVPNTDFGTTPTVTFSTQAPQSPVTLGQTIELNGVRLTGERARAKRGPRKYSAAALAGKSLPELKEIAREVGAPTKRSREDQIASIRATVKG